MTGLEIPWRVLFQRGGEFNWVRSVGTSLIAVAIFQAVSTGIMAARKDARIRAATTQWEAIDAGGDGLKPGESRTIRIDFAQRPEAFAKAYEDELRYRKLWAVGFGLLGVALFFCGNVIEMTASGYEGEK